MQFSEYGTSGVLRIVDLLGGLGSDVAGAVDRVGEGVTALSAGGEVLGTATIARGAQVVDDVTSGAYVGIGLRRGDMDQC